MDTVKHDHEAATLTAVVLAGTGVGADVGLVPLPAGAWLVVVASVSASAELATIRRRGPVSACVCDTRPGRG